MTIVQIGQVVLGVLGVAALIKVVAPPLMFRMNLLRLRVRVDDDPHSFPARSDDASYRQRFEQFEALGFRPLGTTHESCWFISPFDWLWRSRPIHWMVGPDGRTLASLHRLIAEEPVRFSVVTILEGGAMVRTTCPGTNAGAVPVPDNYRRLELRGVEPAELLSRHQTEVSAFAAERGAGAVAVTLQEAANLDAAIDRQTLPRINHAHGEQIIKATFGGPAFLTLVIRALSRGALTWADFAIASCVGAALCETTVRSVVRPAIRARVLATHSAAAGPPPISHRSPDGEQRDPPAGRASSGHTVLLWVSAVIFFMIFWQVLNHR